MESARPPVSAEHDALRAVLEAAPVALVALTRHGVVTVWNPAAASLFGWSSDEILGSAAPADILELCETALRGEKCAPANVSLNRKDGLLVDLRASFGPLANLSGEVYGVVACFSR